MRTRLRFDDDARYDLTEQAVTAYAGYATASGWSLRIALGALLDGSLEGDEPNTYDLGVGPVGAISVARQWTFAGAWFVGGSASLSATSTIATDGMTEARFTAGDLRAGAIAGLTFAQIWQPYVLARGFGGPVWWTIADQEVIGSDTHHFQLGLGSSVATRWGLTTMIDVSLLGEQSVSLGVSWRL